jgi:uncharacterized protein (TIGR02466 family)
MEIKLHQIFPTFITEWDLGRDITEEELSVVEYHSAEDKCHKNKGNIVSNDTYILQDCKSLASINHFIEFGVQHYVSTILKPTNQLKFYITQSWLNYTLPGQYHHKHSHQNSIISGVFYFNADEEKDKIFFYKPELYNRIEFERTSIDWYNADNCWFPVKTGKMMLFPSELMHMVQETETAETRISLAFNVFAKGHFGNQERLSSLYT